MGKAEDVSPSNQKTNLPGDSQGLNLSGDRQELPERSEGRSESEYLSEAVVIIDGGGISQNSNREMIERAFLGAGFQGKLHIITKTRDPFNLQGLERVLLLGKGTVKLYTGLDKLTKRRGSWVNAQGVDALISLPPAWFNKGATHKTPLFYWDVQKYLRGPQHIEEEFYLNPRDPEPFVERVLSQEWIAADTEWYAPHDPAYIAFGDGNGFAFSLKFEPRNDPWIKRILESQVPIVWQNAMFDIVFLEMQGYRTRGEVQDTMVGFHSAYPDLREKGLGTISSIYTPRSYYKEEVEFVGEDDEKGQIYCCRDVDATGAAWPQIQTDLKTTKTDKGYELSMNLFHIFKESTVKGFRVDLEKFEGLRTKYAETADQIEGQLRNALGLPNFNSRSSQQVQNLIFDQFNLKGRKRTSRQDVLMDIAADPRTPLHIRTILTAIIRVRQNRKLVSTYLNDDIFGLDGRVRCNWNLAGTRSGRLASSKMWGQGLALQTIPRSAREIFIPDPDHIFVGFDLAQAEARVVAVLTRDFDLLAAMNNGTDIHCLLGSQITQFNLSYDQMMEKKQNEGGDYRERYLAKKLRHSINYVASPNSIKASINRDYLDTGVGVSLAECRELHARTLEIHPGLPRWWSRVKSQCYSNTGEITNPFGRRRNFAYAGRITDHLHREAVSFYPQSTIADLTTQIISRFYQLAGGRATVLGHFHDGMMAQVKKEDRDAALAWIQEAGDITFEVEGTELQIPIDLKWSSISWGDLG